MSTRRNALSAARAVPQPPSESARFTATQAKNEFARALEMALQGGTVVITKHDAPKAILISIDEFKKLTHAAEFRLNRLSDEFDAMLDRMQGPKARSGMQAAFSASPKELGKAAVNAARKRG
jgi:prevent-host-death family protein